MYVIDGFDFSHLKTFIDSDLMALSANQILGLRQVSVIKYFSQMCMYHLACGDSEITLRKNTLPFYALALNFTFLNGPYQQQKHIQNNA